MKEATPVKRLRSYVNSVRGHWGFTVNRRAIAAWCGSIRKVSGVSMERGVKAF